MKNRRLGKGLSALIPQEDEQFADQKLIEVDVTRVKPNPYQPRLKFDHQALEELKNSIREKEYKESRLKLADGIIDKPIELSSLVAKIEEFIG